MKAASARRGPPAAGSQVREVFLLPRGRWLGLSAPCPSWQARAAAGTVIPAAGSGERHNGVMAYTIIYDQHGNVTARWALNDDGEAVQVERQPDHPSYGEQNVILPG